MLTNINMNYIQTNFLLFMSQSILFIGYSLLDSSLSCVNPDYLCCLGVSIDWKGKLADHNRKHQLVVKFIKDGKQPNVVFLEDVLDFKKPCKITEQHLALCSDIYSKRISMPLPLPHSQHVGPFTELAGQEHYSSKIILAGCYIIKGPNLANSVRTGLTSNECYIGQSTHLGHRVKSHTKGAESTTCNFIKSLKDKGVLELCHLTNETEIPYGLTKNQFITLLEQYLIIKLKPTVNKN